MALQCLAGMARYLHLARLLTLCFAVQLCAQPSPSQHPSADKKHTKHMRKAPAKEYRGPQTNGAKAEELPASAPSVTYALGLLLISADNSTLGDVLAEIGRQTGASVQTPGEIYDRVAVKLGPAQPRTVLAQLLQGAGFDYVIVGAAEDPERIADIVLRRTSPAPPVVGPNPSTANVVAPPPDMANPETAAAVQPKTRHRRRNAVLALISPDGRKAIEPPPADSAVPPFEVIYDQNSAPMPESLQSNPNPLQLPDKMPVPTGNPPPPPPAGSDGNPGFQAGDFSIQRAPSTRPPSSDSMMNSPAPSSTDTPLGSSPTR